MMFIWCLLGDIWGAYVYHTGILGGDEWRRRLHLRVSIFFLCTHVAFFFWVKDSALKGKLVIY